MSDFSEFRGIDSHRPELLLRCVKTLEMDDKAKFEGEERGFYERTITAEQERRPVGSDGWVGRKKFTQKRRALSHLSGAILTTIFGGRTEFFVLVVENRPRRRCICI